MFWLFRLVIRDIKATFDKTLIAFQFALPLLFLFVAGLAYTNLISPFSVNGRQISYQQFLAAGIILQTVMTGSLTAGLLLWIDRRMGMFEQILVWPFTRSQYALSKVVASTIVGIVGSMIVFVFALPFMIGITPSLTDIMIALGSILLAAIFFGSFAVAISTLLKSNEAFNVVINLLYVIFTFVSSTFYPISAAPSLLQEIMLFNPLSHADDLLRFGLYGLASPIVIYESVALITEAFGAFALAVYVFQRIKV